ncbi:sodium-dependent multivitamin transporter-like [Glandiceps talaboti]
MPSNYVTPFGVVDWVIFVAMLLVSAAAGVYHAVVKGGQKTTSSYLVGGRSLSCIPVALSYFVSFTSSIAVMGFPAEIYVHGIHHSFGLFGYIWGTTLSACIFIPFIRQFNFISVYENFNVKSQTFYTLAITFPHHKESIDLLREGGRWEYLNYRYHRSISGIAVLFGALSATVYMGITISGPALAFQAVQGVDLWLTSLIIGVVCTFYTTLGGMKAVIWSDVFQFFVMTAAVVTVLVLGLIEAGGVERVLNYSKEQGKLAVDFSMDPTVRLTYFTMILNGGFQTFSSSFNQAAVQRLLGSKSVRSAQGSLLLTIPIKWFFYGMSYATGLILFTYYNNNISSLQPGINATFSPGMNYGGQIGRANYQPDYTSADQVIVYFISSQLGRIPGIQGLFISCLFAGAMSSISSGLNAIAAMILRDIVKPWRHHRTKVTGTPCEKNEAFDTNLSKLVSLIFGVVATAISLAVPYVGTLLESTNSLLSVFNGPLAGTYILGMCYPRSNTCTLDTRVEKGG